MTKQNDDQPVTQSQMGVFIEHMNDQFARVLEAVESSTSKIPKMSERIEKLQYDLSMAKLGTFGQKEDIKLIKIRTEKIQDKLDKIESELKTVKDHEKRLTALEAA